MTEYQNRGGDSGIIAYEIFPESIQVKFSSNWVYEYNYAITGQQEVEHMKSLARNGEGLNSYIKTEIGTNFANKWPA